MIKKFVKFGRIQKKHKCLSNFFFAFIVFYFVPVFCAPNTETLILINRSWLSFYALLYGLSFIVLLEIFGHFENDFPLNKFIYLFFIFLSSSGAAFFLILIVWLVEYQFIGRYVIAYSIGITVFFSFILFMFFQKISSALKTKVLLLVSLKNSEKIKSEMVAKNNNSIEFFYLSDIGVKNDSLTSSTISDLRCVVVEQTDQLNEIQIIDLLSSGIRILSLHQFWCEWYRVLPAEHVDLSMLAELDLFKRRTFRNLIKRLSDIVFSFIGFFVFSPFLLVGILAIIFDSGFPVFFSQTRSGLMGRPYKLYKLRSMRTSGEVNNTRWAVKKDKRITTVGKVLRKWRVDEIPQLWNIFKGEMSIVGPRPEIPELDQYLNTKIPNWKWRSMVKPGLTGWAQVNYEYASDLLSSKEKLAYDLYYLKNISLTLDLEIVLSTLRTISNGSR